jgi:FtsZ-binding cell division protein ZapB
MARALKVFSYSDGFHSWTVAAPSRAKALAAWGVKRDLFKDGSAKEISEGKDREAALASPGELIERGLSVDIGKVGKTAAPKAKAKRGPSAKDVARVKALEAELAELDEAQAGEAGALEERREKLEREAAALSKDQSKARETLKAKLKAARAKLS